MATTILGISPGTRSLGIGILRNTELIEWQVKTFKGRWSKEKMNMILDSIQSLIEHFKITEVAFKEVSPLRSSRNLIELTKQITVLAKKRQMLISLFTIQDLKQSIESNGKHTRDGLIEFVFEKYPMVKREYHKERNNLNPYYLRMFEAIAAAYISSREY